MIELREIGAAVGEAIAARHPGEVVYYDLAPKGFERPSWLVECLDVAAERLNYAAVQMTAQVKVTCFAQADVRGLSPAAELMARQTSAMGVLLRGYVDLESGARLRVCGPVDASSGYDFAEVTARVEWQEDWAQFEMMDTMALIESVDLGLSAKE